MDGPQDPNLHVVRTGQRYGISGEGEKENGMAWAWRIVALGSFALVLMIWWEWVRENDRKMFALARCILDHEDMDFEAQQNICERLWPTYQE